MDNFIAIAIFIIIAGLAINVWHSNEQDRKRPYAPSARIFLNGVEITAATLRVNSGYPARWEPAETAVCLSETPVVTATLTWDTSPDDITLWAREPVNISSDAGIAEAK